MSLPFSGTCNVGGYDILPSEINLITALGSGGSDVSDTFKIQGGTLYVCAVLASGQTTISAKTDSSTPIANPASGGDATSITLVGAGAKGFIRLDSSSSNIYAAIKNVDANWSSSLSALDIFVLYEKSASRDFFWYSTDNMENGGAVVVSSLPR